MKNEDLEILSDDLKNFDLSFRKENDNGEELLKKIPQKPDNIFIEPYKKYFIAANFSGGGWITVLSAKAKKVLDLVNGKRTVEEIYHKFILESKKEKKLFIKKIFGKSSVLAKKDLLRFFEALEITRLIFFEKNHTHASGVSKKKIDVWMQLTNQCNFRCKYCYISQKPERMGYGKATLIINKIFESAEKNNISEITLRFSGGEPLLEFETIKKVVSYIFTKYDGIIGRKIKLRMMIITNASLIDKEFINFVKRNKIKIVVSLDSLKEKDKNKLARREEKTLSLSKNGIELLIKNKVKFNVLAIVTSANLKKLPALAKWLLKNKIWFRFNFVRKNPLISWDMLPTNKELTETLLEICGIVKKNISRISSCSMINNGIPKKNYGHSCGFGSSFTAISENGEIFPCHMALSQKNMRLGSVFPNADIHSLINNPESKKLNLSREEKKSCMSCKWSHICSDSCPMFSIFSGRDALDPYYYCQTYKVLIPEILKLEAERLLYKRN